MVGANSSLFAVCTLSGLLAIRILLLLLVRALCSSFPLTRLIYSRFSHLVRAGLLYPLRLSFLVSRLFFLVTSLGFHLPTLTPQSSLAALLGSVSPVHHSLLAMFVRPLLPFLFFLGFRCVSLLL